MVRIRGERRKRQQVRIGAADGSLTANAGLAVVSELCGRLGVIEALDAAVGPVKQRDRGFGAGGLLCGIAAAQLAGEDFLTGLDRQRADAAGQQITPVPGLASTTAAGLARRVTPAQWQAVEAGLAAVTGRMLVLLPAERAAALADGPVTAARPRSTACHWAGVTRRASPAAVVDASPGTGAISWPAASARCRSSPVRKSSPASCAAAIPHSSSPAPNPRSRCLMGPTVASSSSTTPSRSHSSVTAAIPAFAVSDASGAPARTR